MHAGSNLHVKTIDLSAVYKSITAYLECKQFHVQYTIRALNKVIRTTISRPRRTQRQTSSLYGRTYGVVCHQRRISLAQAWLASIFMRSSRSPVIFGIARTFLPPTYTFRIIPYFFFFRHRASEMDQYSLEFCAHCRCPTCSISCKQNYLFSSESRLSRKPAKNYRPVTESILKCRWKAIRHCISALQWGHAMAQLVEAVRYKSEGRGVDSWWCHWNFSLT